MRCVFVGVVAFVFFGVGLAHQTQTNDYNRDVLAPLTKYRQQHRRTVDGRLCAAAFVQNRKAYTGCTDATNPVGESGRPWCYVEPQVGVSFVRCEFAGDGFLLALGWLVASVELLWLLF